MIKNLYAIVKALLLLDIVCACDLSLLGAILFFTNGNATVLWIGIACTIAFFPLLALYCRLSKTTHKPHRKKRK